MATSLLIRNLYSTLSVCALVIAHDLPAQTANNKLQLPSFTTMSALANLAPNLHPTTIWGDPLNVRVHTLDNGLKLFMSVNKNEPRVYTNIAVRAGSKQDPAETTGLAHYLEHMMFKGTSQLAALDWEKEKGLLKEIADLYEQHKAEKDPSVRKALYAKIDSVSGEAAKLVAANEYDKLISSLGAKGTNAYTNNEATVYVNDIPSNELEKWFQVEGERFKAVVLRLFHTELEAVYEEFNIGQDNDGRKVFAATLSNLFPSHPYGTQTTIGRGEHLKSPSHYNILDFFKKYYVPNNMAIVVAGDFDPAQVIALADKYFGAYSKQVVPEWSFEKQEILRGVKKTEVFGQQAAYVQLAYRLGGTVSGDHDMATMVSGMLYNRQAGLIDLELVQSQKVLEASAFSFNLTDYSSLFLSGRPRDGQSLENVEKLLVEQIERLKKGDFPDWLLSAAK
jgi:predicted Zn-dependent peptidase